MNISAASVKVVLHQKELSKVERNLLEDPNLRLKVVNVYTFLTDTLFSNNLLLMLSPDLKIFQQALMKFPVNRGNHWKILYDEFLIKCKEIGADLSGVGEAVKNQSLSTKLEEIKNRRTNEVDSKQKRGAALLKSFKDQLLLKKTETPRNLLKSNIEETVNVNKPCNGEEKQGSGQYETDDTDEAEDDDRDAPQKIMRSLPRESELMVNVERMPRHDNRLTSANPMNQSRILYHQPPGSKPITAYNKVSEAKFPPQMNSFLTSINVTSSTTIQSILWPAVLRLKSVVALAEPGMGNTLGWVLPIVQHCSQPDQYKHLHPGHSPLCIVLCSGVNSVNNIFTIIDSVSRGAGLGIKTLMACSGVTDPHITDFINGSEILVTTPPKLLKLLTDEAIISLDRCCHLIIDDADFVFSHWHRLLDGLFRKWRMSRKKEGKLDQVVVVGHQWSQKLEDFVLTHVNSLRPVFVTSNLLEGMVYGKNQLLLTYVADNSEEIRRSKLMEILKSTVKMKMVICCSALSETRRLKLFLSQHGIQCLVISGGEDMATMKERLDVWQLHSKFPLIVSDEMLPSIAFPGAESGTCLVHWDVPTSSKSTFALRFAFVKHCFQNIFSGHKSQESRVHMFLTPDDEMSFNAMIPFLKRCSVTIPQELTTFIQTKKDVKTEENITLKTQLCLEMVGFGSCSSLESGKCNLRHSLDLSLDTPSSQVTQVIRFTILTMQTPVLYWVRLEDEEFQLSHQKLVLKLAKHFSNTDHHQPLETLKLQSLVAAAGEDGVYRRARLVNQVYQRRGEMEQLVAMVVFLIDSGTEEEVRLDDIAELPEEFGLKYYPAAARRVFISGVVPGDDDRDWGDQVLMHLINRVSLRPSQDK